MKWLLLIFTAAVSFYACNSRQQSQAGNPGCINAMIDKFKLEAVQNPPRSVTQFEYQGKTVYYVPAVCCDQMSAVYDSECNFLGAPDGGITGKGDGKLPGFRDSTRNERVIWKDAR